MRIRAVTEADIDLLVPLNNAAVPAVNALRREELARFAAIVPHFRVVELPDRLGGMMVALGPGAGYESPNYRWFEERYDTFLYVDRIVVDPGMRSAGVGAALYADLLSAARAAAVPRITCEVNLRPANERSLRFHERLGFRGVGTQDTEDGAKTVQLMVMELGGEGRARG